MKVLLTGASGKVGQNFITTFNRKQLPGIIRALCHKRMVEESETVRVFRGSLISRADIEKAMAGISHVIHLATTKEDPDTIMDVSVRGMFWLLEACRASPSFKQFIMIGGDAAVGHIFHPKNEPNTEDQKKTPYQGCYALSKALEEDMLEYYHFQYGLNGCCLRSSWIMEKDDFKYVLKFGEEQFGGPSWSDLIGEEKNREYAQGNFIPLIFDKNGSPLKRNFIHVEDLGEAIDNPNVSGEVINIAMSDPLDYG